MKRVLLTSAVPTCVALLVACGSNTTTDDGSGGSFAAGGAANAGGNSSAGGAASSGGSTGIGGGALAGGGPSVGGGNGPASGGSNGEGSGGAEASGGATGNTGGSSNPGAINWGKEEDPTAGCPVSDDLPSYAELMADGKLPDPFKMLDGTRITDKSQWACRRAELVKQIATYIYGEKPIPPKESVSGTVSTSSISVKVTGGQKDATFNVTVNMNGATAPAPAIISYGAGASAPNGVARITFTAIESQGGSGAKNGPFFDYYGNNHPAGYMVAQAWQISRIIDVLEQHPEVIDPTRIGLTGCSRNGKGAFAGGVFDNRVALTIPVESGMGGTVGLRLKSQLDPGANDTAEWPYHAISYVRWLSEVALGPFATGNNDAGDNTDRLPVDMHSAMALIAPRAIYVVDNPSISNLDPKSAHVAAMAGKAIFEALGVGDHFAYQGAGGGHCQWRSQYTPSLDAMVNRFLKGQDSTQTGNVATDLANPPNATQYYDWDSTELSGEL